jgi:hypothetical protein
MDKEFSMDELRVLRFVFHSAANDDLAPGSLVDRAFKCLSDAEKRQTVSPTVPDGLRDIQHGCC